MSACSEHNAHHLGALSLTSATLAAIWTAVYCCVNKNRMIVLKVQSAVMACLQATVASILTIKLLVIPALKRCWIRRESNNNASTLPFLLYH